jgi:hypothetical protein
MNEDVRENQGIEESTMIETETKLMVAGLNAVDKALTPAPALRIITSFDYPPIPDRSMDWSAVREGYDGAEDSHCIIGRGPTEQAAIADLIEKESE